MPVTTADFITAHATEGNSVFVFPSEVIASFWRAELLRLTNRVAVRADRFISWDTFKEMVFRSHQTRRPANRLYRTVFVSAFLARNRESPFLKRLVDPVFSENSEPFERYIGSVLAGLRALFHKRRSSVEAVIGPELTADLLALYQGYSDFLDRFGLFEPAWAEAEISSITRDYFLFFTEVLDDFHEYAQKLEASDGITVVQLPEAASGSVRQKSALKLREYENSVQETRALLDLVEQLLDEGAQPGSIVITLLAAADYQMFLAREALLRRIPLAFRAGKTLSDYPAGRFLDGIGRASTAGYSVSALGSLCLDQAVPWRDRTQNQALVRFGLHWNVARSWTERDGTRRDAWVEGFTLAGAGRSVATLRETPDDATAAGQLAQGLLSYYRRLRRSIDRILKAKTFRLLRDAVYAFYEEFLDTASWDADDLPAFQSCMEILSDLVTAEAELSGAQEGGHGLLDGINPYTLWISSLKDKLYVPRGRNEGIPVYSYRVSAGLCPAHHFIVGASHDATRVILGHYSYLRDDEKERLLVGDQDLSDPFMDLYVRSGKEVSISYARETQKGAQLASGYFVRRRLVEPVPVSRSTMDGYRAERLFWESGDPLLMPSRLYPSQLSGLMYQAETGFAPRGADFLRDEIDDDVVRRLLLEDQLSTRYEGFLHLSAAHLESFRTCPFAYSLLYGLAVREEPFELDYYGALTFGNLYHQVLEELYRAIASNTGVFQAESAEEYRRLLDSLIDRAVQPRLVRVRLSLDGRVPVPAARPLYQPLAEVFRRSAKRLLPLLIAADVEFSSGHRLESAEDWFSTQLPDSGVELFGRIDRITRDPERDDYTLVDYKKNRAPGRSAFERLLSSVGAGATAAKDSEDNEDSESEDRAETAAIDSGVLQIPVYAVLARAKNRDLDRAAYYSIESGKYITVFDRSGPRGLVDAGELDELMGRVTALVGVTAERIRRGDYRVGTEKDGREAGCDGCPMRSVCRARYAVRTL